MPNVCLTLRSRAVYMLYHVTNNEPLLQASVPWSGNRKTSNLYLICSDVIFLDRGPIPGLLPIDHFTVILAFE